MQHITQVKRAMKKLYVLQLPTRLQQYDLEAADGILTPPPSEVHATSKNALGGYPAIELYGRGSSHAIDSHAQDYRHRIIVGVTLVGDDEETLDTQVERYLYTLRQIGFDTCLGDPPAAPMEPGNEEYTPVRRQDGLEIPFVKGGFIEMFVKTLE